MYEALDHVITILHFRMVIFVCEKLIISLIS